MFESWENIDEVDIMETWKIEENQWDSTISGYKPYRRNREESRGGGVAIYYKGIKSPVLTYQRKELGNSGYKHVL